MDFDEYFSQFSKELNQIDDFRLQVLFLHLNIEYWLNKIIKKNFKNSKVIFDNRDLRTFSNKLDLIKSLNLLHPRSGNLMEKIKLINAIRNYYSHNIVGKEEFPEEIRSRITELMKSSPAKKDFNKRNISETHQFVISCVGIIQGLHTSYESVNLPETQLN